MKIKKFNENQNSSDELYYVIINCGNDVEDFGLFKTAEDRDKYSLNYINDKFVEDEINDIDDVFTDINNAIEWLSFEYDNNEPYTIEYGESNILENIYFCATCCFCF